MVYYKNLSTCCFTRKEVRDRLGTARFTETSKILSEWVDQMIEKYESKADETVSTLDYAVSAGFGPEAHLDESDPNFQTRMIT